MQPAPPTLVPGLVPGRSITAPTQHAQVAVMREAAARAGRCLGDFDYVEAHATGTVVGTALKVMP